MITNTELVRIDLKIHRPYLVNLTLEYTDWAAKQLLENYNLDIAATLDIPLEKYLNNLIDKFCAETSPKGIYYLLKSQDEYIGMGCLRKIREDIAEIKRMYVRPAYRRYGFGKIILQGLLLKAREFGYKSVYLDSANFMKTAHQLYYSLGFVDRNAYPESEVLPELIPDWVFMEKTL